MLTPIIIIIADTLTYVKTVFLANKWRHCVCSSRPTDQHKTNDTDTNYACNRGGQHSTKAYDCRALDYTNVDLADDVVT